MMRYSFKQIYYYLRIDIIGDISPPPATFSCVNILVFIIYDVSLLPLKNMLLYKYGNAINIRQFTTAAGLAMSSSLSIRRH